MTQEPWKRAAQLSQQQYRSGGRNSPAGPTPPPNFRSQPRIGCIVGWIVLFLVVAGGAALFFTRGYWLPRYRGELPEPVAEAIADIAPEPERSVDWHTVEGGLKADLTPFGDYLLFVGHLGDWQVEPRLVETGGGTWRITAPGVRVYVQQNRIWNYDLDLPAIFANKQLAPWWPALRQANLTPDLTWTALTGEAEMPHGATQYEYSSTRSTHLAEGWAYPEYILHFVDGWLRHVELGVRFGVSDEAGSEQPPH